MAPGQGSQTPGMLVPWLDLPGAEATVRWMSHLTGLDLLRLGTTAEADEIRDTAVTQPLVVSLALIAAAELELSGSEPIVAGHSVGELAAAAIAGVLHRDTAVALAAVRGAAMAAACGQADTTMAAVLGGDESEVLTRLEELGLSPANRNGAGQIVAAGATDAVARLKADPPTKARVMPLSVAGAFHTPYMQTATDILTSVEGGIISSDPIHTLLSNADGRPVRTGPETVAKLVAQVTAPVRWDLCMATMLERGVTALIELPPAGALTGLAKRGMKGVTVLAVKTPDDLSRARELIHDTATGASQTEES